MSFVSPFTFAICQSWSNGRVVRPITSQLGLLILDIVHEHKREESIYNDFRVTECKRPAVTFSSAPAASTYIYVHLRTSTYIYVHLCTSTYIYAHLRTSTHIYEHLRTYTHIYAHLRTSTHIYAHLRTSIYFRLCIAYEILHFYITTGAIVGDGIACFLFHSVFHQYFTSISPVFHQYGDCCLLLP